MADPRSNLSPQESLGKRVFKATQDKLHTLASSVGSVTEPIYKAAEDVTKSALHLIRHPPENPGAFSKAPPYEKPVEEISPIKRTDEYEKKHPFAPYSLSKKNKNTILQKDNGIISSQLDMRSLNTVRIFTGIEVYNLSVRLDADTSMYNTTPIRDKEGQVFINSSPEVVKKRPDIIMTLTDFNEKYLKWMDGITDTQDNIKNRKRDLKNLFKFVFNNSKINDVTTSFLKKLQRIAHTPLDTEDKLPCQGSQLYEDFKRSLEYRLPEAKKEMEVALATFGEMNSYAQQKTILYDGIDDLVRLMSGGYARGCIKYEYGNKSDYRVVMDLAEQNRIMRLFIQFIKKQESSGYMEPGTLQERLKDKDKYLGVASDAREGKFNELYDELTGILESMRKSQGPSSSEEIESLKEQLKEKDLAILALESLLQISIQITHLNEGYMELEERYQRVETKMESEKLFEQYEKFRGLLRGLRLNASMQGLIECGEQLAEIMIRYSVRKDISVQESFEARSILNEVREVLANNTSGGEIHHREIHNGLLSLYAHVDKMIIDKFKAGLGPASVPAPGPASVPAPGPAPAPMQTQTQGQTQSPVSENTFSKISIGGNGWCFYASILRGLNEPFDEPACLKFATEISEWLKANKKTIVHKNGGTTLEAMYEITPGNSLIPVYCDQYAGKKVDLDTYIESSITQTATGGPCVWAETGVAGWAAADLKNIQIDVYNDVYKNIERYSPTTGNPKTTINIINTGKNHFDLLIPKNNNQLPPNTDQANRRKYDQQGGKPTPQQKLQAIFDIESNSDTKTYCDTVLTLLLIDMKRKMYDFDANKFMKKVGTSLGDIKPCPVVFHILKVILDEGMKQVIDSNAYIFSPQKPLDYTEDTFQNLEQRYAETFDDGEKEAFENMTPIRYYHRTPEEFHDLLGDSPYFLSGHSDDAEPELRGVDVDGLYDEPLRMTADEKQLLTCRGIPLGAIIFMYITAVANNKRSELLKSLQSDPLLE